MPSTESAPVPAWKRLGLKLKQPGAGAGSAPASGSLAVGQPGGSTGHKRKVEAPPSTDGTPVKKTRREEQPVTQNGSSSSSKPKKSVKFGDTPTKNEGRSPPPPRRTKIKPTKEEQQAKKAKSPAKNQTPLATDTIKPALEYLRQWRTSRESWKFNKNHQSALIKHIFEPDTIPASDVDAFYEYIRDLKGFVRQRLRETAMEIKMHDVDGTSGFPDDTMDIDEKQEAYDSILADILRRKRQQNGPKRKFFSETQYISESQDGDVIIRRVVKRMRAELVLEELSDSGNETENTSTSTTSSKTVTASDNNATTRTNGDKQQPKLNDGPGRRRRKLRVNMEDSSSSESSSESDSDDTSSSSSDDDSDSDEEAEARPSNGYDTSSSSSSSSSSGDSDSEEESDDED